MKTKNIILGTFAALAMVSCEDYTVHNFGEASDLWQPTEVNNYEFTLTANDYDNIAKNAQNQTLAENIDCTEELKSVASKKALTGNISAQDYLPAILPSLLGSKYYAATAGTTVTLHYTQELVKDSIINGSGYNKVIASKVSKGEYLIVPTGTDSVLTSTKGDGEYGYLYPTAITRLTATSIAADEVSNVALWNISGDEDGFYLQNQADVYAYLDDTHASFQFVEDLGDLDEIDDATWAITKNADGTYAIQNVGKQKTMWYSTQYKSAGAYSERNDVMLDVELYKSGSVSTTIQVTYTEDATIKFTAEKNEETGEIEWNANGAYLNQVLLDMNSTDPEAIYDYYGWSIEFVGGIGDLSYVWNASSSYGLRASAYKSGTYYATDAWIISPVMNLKKAKNPVFTFEQAQKYAGTPLSDYLQVWVSTDYKSRGDQPNAAWTNVTDKVTGEWPDGSSWDYMPMQLDLSAYAGMNNVVVAFRYISTDAVAATWEVKNVLCKEAE